MDRGVALSREKSLRRQEICTAIGRQLRECYNQSLPLSDGLADLVRKIQQSNHGEPLPQDEEAPGRANDA